MNNLIHIGYGNIINTSKIVAIVSPDAAPIKRMVQGAKEQGTVIDATQGRKTKAVLVMEQGQVVLSALLPETIVNRATIHYESDAMMRGSCRSEIAERREQDEV